MFQKASPETLMYAYIRFSSHGTHNLPELYFCAQYVYFLHTDIKPTSIWPKIEVHVESNFHFGPPIDFSTTSMQ